MIKLVVTDLDGTFLNSQGSFDMQLFKEVHEVMKHKGVTFVACTGKQCERVEKLFGEHGKGVWILGDSAARIKKDGQVVREFSMERTLALQAIEEIQLFDPQMTIIVCASDAAYVHTSISDEMYDVVKSSYEQVIKTDSFAGISTSFIKITVFDPHGRCTALRKHVEQTMEGQIYIVDSEHRWLDITALHTHKGETVKTLQKMLGVTFDETMSFGDGENDVELMGIARYSFAMSNACENTKRAAQFITKSNDENGVLVTIQAMMDLQEVYR
ncbi:Cof subfamily protein (haloacid dehalogenase superfamily) [Paenibacillus sp. JGP012]|uniref:Cof-type HAD-IIB family hydrolase n=1 Tax=Paenibacillus sp. JGP012 TaxID=2735914 RepID=UPI001612B8B8|nr:Cof-type HAD-IIB family hydrolase [Paenibacillus sp. JGP012]MBB6020280.1 Cof subfamily protein (haloacid dehalogenase superfamily) [Paenibacillus sp. JGP012]